MEIISFRTPLDLASTGLELSLHDDCLAVKSDGAGIRMRIDTETAWGLDAMFAPGADLRDGDIRYSQSRAFGTVHPVVLKWIGEGALRPTPSSAAVLIQAGHVIVLGPEQMGALALALTVAAGTGETAWSIAETARIRELNRSGDLVRMSCHSPDGGDGPEVEIPAVAGFRDDFFHHVCHREKGYYFEPLLGKRYGEVRHVSSEWPFWAKYMLVDRKTRESLEPDNRVALLSPMACGAFMFALSCEADFSWCPKRPERKKEEPR